MATTVPTGSDGSADAYRCLNCGNESNELEEALRVLPDMRQRRMGHGARRRQPERPVSERPIAPSSDALT